MNLVWVSLGCCCYRRRRDDDAISHRMSHETRDHHLNQEKFSSCGCSCRESERGGLCFLSKLQWYKVVVRAAPDDGLVLLVGEDL